MTPDSQARQHCLTASRAKRLLSGHYKTWNTLAKEMRATQREIGEVTPFTPASLAWGTTHEPWVRAQVWESFPEWEIVAPGFQRHHLDHPLLSRHCGCTPDGLIRPLRWGYEGKAPYDPAIYESYIDGECPEIYIPQVQWSLWVTGWEKWVFAAGDPRREDEGNIKVAIVDPDPAMHDRFHELAVRFLETYTMGEEFKPQPRTAAAFDEMF